MFINSDNYLQCRTKIHVMRKNGLRKVPDRFFFCLKRYFEDFHLFLNYSMLKNMSSVLDFTLGPCHNSKTWSFFTFLVFFLQNSVVPTTQDHFSCSLVVYGTFSMLNFLLIFLTIFPPRRIFEFFPSLRYFELDALTSFSSPSYFGQV